MKQCTWAVCFATILLGVQFQASAATLPIELFVNSDEFTSIKLSPAGEFVAARLGKQAEDAHA
jgi:hypothetical protein